MKRPYCVPITGKLEKVYLIFIIFIFVFVMAISSLLGGCASYTNNETKSQQTGSQTQNPKSNSNASTYSNDNTPPLDTAGPSNSNEQMIYRVRVGPYTSRSNSEEASKGLSSLGYPVSIVNDGSYYVQIGAFSVEENAEKLKQEAISRGFEVIVTSSSSNKANINTSTYSNDNTPPLDTAGPSNSNEQMIYRVRVGPYTSRSNSEEASKDLSSLGYPVSIVNDGSYYVQIGAFSVEENAEKLKQEAISRGFEVIVTPSSSNKAEFAVEEPIENRQIVNALDYFPLFDNRRYIAPSGNGSYVFGFANIVKINGVSYIKYGEDPLFAWGFYDPDYVLYSLIDYDGITWICSMGVGKYGELEMRPSPLKVMPLNIEIGKEYMAGVQELLGLYNCTFYLQDITTSDGVTIKNCLIQEKRYGYGSSDRNADFYSSYLRDRGLFMAGTIPPDKGIEWSENPAAFKDSVSNRNYLRSFEDNKEQKEIDAKLMDILRTIKSYYKFGDIEEIFGAEPYYSTPYESGIFGYGGVAFWRFNGREVMINFKKSDYVDHIIVDEGSFYMKNF